MDFIRLIREKFDIESRLLNLKKFNKEQRSTFDYWWNHWKAVNLLAIKLDVWSPKLLIHDWEKPWLRLVGVSYKKIQKFHRSNSDHHVEYSKGPRNFLEMVLDWEASRYTKLDASLTARETVDQLHPEVRIYLEPILNKLKL